MTNTGNFFSKLNEEYVISGNFIKISNNVIFFNGAIKIIGEHTYPEIIPRWAIPKKEISFMATELNFENSNVISTLTAFINENGQFVVKNNYPRKPCCASFFYTI